MSTWKLVGSLILACVFSSSSSSHKLIALLEEHS